MDAAANPTTRNTPATAPLLRKNCEELPPEFVRREPGAGVDCETSSVNVEPSEVRVTVSSAGVVTKVDPSEVTVIERGTDPENVTVGTGELVGSFDGLAPGPEVEAGVPVFD